MTEQTAITIRRLREAMVNSPNEGTQMRADRIGSLALDITLLIEAMERADKSLSEGRLVSVDSEGCKPGELVLGILVSRDSVPMPCKVEWRIVDGKAALE